jgi:hypothetical protein
MTSIDFLNDRNSAKFQFIIDLRLIAIRCKISHVRRSNKMIHHETNPIDHLVCQLLQQKGPAMVAKAATATSQKIQYTTRNCGAIFFPCS